MDAFRAAQELLTNVFKHAQVRRATVRVEPLQGHLVMQVTDDGVGFAASGGPGGDVEVSRFGLFNLKERFAGLGGHVHVDAACGGGAEVVVTAPLAAADIRGHSDSAPGDAPGAVDSAADRYNKMRRM